MKEFEIAKVLKPQGIKGEIKVELFTTDLDFLRSLSSFKIEDKIYTIVEIRFQKKYAFIKTQEITTRNNAETFRNKILFAKRPEINNTDEFYIEDLQDCCVVDENNNIIGYVESVEKYSTVANINILIGGAIRSFPFLKQVIKKVDVKEKLIVVDKQKLNEVLVWK